VARTKYGRLPEERDGLVAVKDRTGEGPNRRPERGE
jgi:hypothetical protein